MDRLLITAALAGALLLCSAPAPRAASFDCGKAANETEKAICAMPVLSEFDEAVAQAFAELRDALATAGDGPRDAAVTALLATQRNWLRERNQCHTDEPCLMHQHERRMAMLQGEPDPDAGSPLDSFLGSYESAESDEENYGLVLIKGEGALAIALFTGAAQSWTCAFTGIARLDAQGALRVAHAPDGQAGAEIGLRIVTTVDGIAVEPASDTASSRYCGQGGSLAQPYRKTFSDGH